MKYFRGGLIALALIFVLVPVPSKANNNHYYYAGKYKKGELSVKVYKNSQKKALKKGEDCGYIQIRGKDWGNCYLFNLHKLSGNTFLAKDCEQFDSYVKFKVSISGNTLKMVSCNKKTTMGFEDWCLKYTKTKNTEYKVKGLYKFGTVKFKIKTNANSSKAKKGKECGTFVIRDYMYKGKLDGGVLYKWGKNKYRTDPTKYINANGEFAIHTRLYITVGKNYIVVSSDKKSVRKSDPVFDNKKYKLVKR